MARMRFACKAGTSGWTVEGKKTRAIVIRPTATDIMTALTARSWNLSSKALAKRVMPQPRAVVYSQRLPMGGRSTAMARVTIDAVKAMRAHRLATLPRRPTNSGGRYSTGTETLTELVAAARYTVQLATEASTQATAPIAARAKPAMKRM